MPKKTQSPIEIRQGDVYLVPVAELPADCKPVAKDPRGLVLAEGETSMHHHALVGRGAKLLQRAGTSQRFVVVGRAGAELLTVGGGTGGGAVPRHTPIPMAPGVYKQIPQRVATSANVARRVVD